MLVKPNEDVIVRKKSDVNFFEFLNNFWSGVRKRGLAFCRLRRVGENLTFIFFAGKAGRREVAGGF